MKYMIGFFAGISATAIVIFFVMTYGYITITSPSLLLLGAASLALAGILNSAQKADVELKKLREQ